MRISSLTLLFFCLVVMDSASRADKKDKKLGPSTLWILTKDGKSVEGTTDEKSFAASVNGESREIKFSDLLSVSDASSASEHESGRITSDLAAVKGSDHHAMEEAVAELSDIGLPVLSPLLATYKDTDLHEPNPLYRLYGRIIPGYADQLDRSLDLIRLVGGVTMRGKAHIPDLTLHVAGGQTESIPGTSIRRLAVRRQMVDRVFEVEALRHCTQIEFLDSGVRATDASTIDARAEGYVRLSFDIDAWSCDPDGIKVPGPNYKTTDVDGFAFGALVAKVGPSGARWKAGKTVKKTSVGSGRLYFAVNDNGHWQNNLGSYRVRLHVTDAYDLADPL
jgi:hypothetical protein